MCNRRAALLLLLGISALACRGQDHPPGEIEGARLPAALVASRQAAQETAALRLGAPTKRILFGDLHVHTTYSIDAFIFSLPIFSGEGAHPPADACDFARYCSSLDFFSINDHAEGLLPERWRATVESLRACNARAGDPADPDLVGFVGFEWTQVGQTPATHYGHKNVMFPGLAEDELPARPIDALPRDVMDRASQVWLLRALQTLRPFGLSAYADFLWLIERMTEIPNCPEGVPAREVNEDCRDSAPTPAALFRKLDEWGFPSLVIPHGTAWGVHTPPGTRFDKQLSTEQHDPARQRLIEVYSGHGNSEEFRSLPELAQGGASECAEPTANFLPCCWRAGEIVRERCGDLPAAECEARVREARRLTLEAGEKPHWVLPDASVEDWLDCDQCRDCFKPAFALRPGHSAQYALAIAKPATKPDAPPLRFRFGFIGSTDNHSARPGTGYKQIARKKTSDARGITSKFTDDLLRPWIDGRQEDPQRAQAVPDEPMGFRRLLDIERGASFMHPGGLVAVHATGRDRGSIWRALETREVYGTSGPRILLWFDLVNAPGAPAAMGSEVAMAAVPRFQVRAIGSFVQKPGCPQATANGLSPERLDQLCGGECYHPGDARHRIASIEVVRIRPRIHPDEPMAALIDDPWRRFDCPPDDDGCQVSFEDPEFPGSGRDALYYARALQVETPAVNGANLRTEFDAAGNATRVNPCFGNYRTPEDDDCLAPVQERAWSSPIFVNQAPGD